MGGETQMPLSSSWRPLACTLVVSLLGFIGTAFAGPWSIFDIEPSEWSEADSFDTTECLSMWAPNLSEEAAAPPTYSVPRDPMTTIPGDSWIVEAIDVIGDRLPTKMPDILASLRARKRNGSIRRYWAALIVGGFFSSIPWPDRPPDSRDVCLLRALVAELRDELAWLTLASDVCELMLAGYAVTGPARKSVPTNFMSATIAAARARRLEPDIDHEPAEPCSVQIGKNRGAVGPMVFYLGEEDTFLARRRYMLAAIRHGDPGLDIAEEAAPHRISDKTSPPTGSLPRVLIRYPGCSATFGGDLSGEDLRLLGAFVTRQRLPAPFRGLAPEARRRAYRRLVQILFQPLEPQSGNGPGPR